MDVTVAAVTRLASSTVRSDLQTENSHKIRYRSNDMWDDALRVAKFHGGQGAHKRVAYAWALALGGEAGAKLLTKQVRAQQGDIPARTRTRRAVRVNRGFSFVSSQLS